MPAFRPLLLIPAALLAAATSAGAQDAQYPTRAAPADPPIYKCGATYTQVNCGGRQVNGHRVTKTFDKNTLPPQDRARRMARAMLPPETREKCGALEARIRNEEARLKTRQEPATEAEEGDLAIQRVHYREMHC
jgi:hypothetical protein